MRRRTSGYRWVPEALDDAILAALDDAFTPPEPGLLGASGRHRFRFAIVGPGQTALRLVLRRPWDAAAVAETFETTIDAAFALRAEGGDEDALAGRKRTEGRENRKARAS